MKKLLMVAALGAAGLVSGTAHAATTADTFDVLISVTPVCTVSTPVTDVSFAYTSGGGAVASTGGGFAVTCTSGVSYNLSLDQTVVTDDAVNLDYTLSFSSGTGPFSGNGGSQAYTVNGNMVAGQAGACPLGVCDNTAATNRQRTLTVTY